MSLAADIYSIGTIAGTFSYKAGWGIYQNEKISQAANQNTTIERNKKGGKERADNLGTFIINHPKETKPSKIDCGSMAS